MPEVQKTLYLVFSNWRPGREAEFHEWYAEHVAQILAVEGFESARRMTRTEIEGRPSPEYAHVVAYEISGDANEAFRKLRAAREAGSLSMPDPEIVDPSFKGMVYGLED
jgi:heme-degrading monooxygenase HmoA